MSDHLGEGSVPESRDGLESWLSEPVRPLLPPPGAFGRIRRRARRRKAIRALASVAGVAVVAAGAAAAPRLVTPQLTHRTQESSGTLGNAAGPRMVPGGGFPRSSAGPTPSRAPQEPRPRPLSKRAIASVPADFQVSSVTFVGASTGWAIGQAGSQHACTGPGPGTCPSLARTNDGGKTWYRVSAPPTQAPDSRYGVSQVRFLELQDGWAFGPELWATHDGGTHWRRIPTHGLRVILLETVGRRAFAVWALCRGTASVYAAGCTRFYLYSSPAAGDRWQPVLGASLSAAARGGSVAMALNRSRLYLLGPAGEMLTTPVGGTPRLAEVSRGGSRAATPCAPGPPGPPGLPGSGGRPTGALLAATGKPPQLILLCLGAQVGDTQVKTLFYSANGGISWARAGHPPAAGVAESLSGSPSCGALLATSQGIEFTGTVGKGMARVSGNLPADGFSYVGMTTRKQGVAVPADRSLHAVWLTYDSGLTWTRHPVASGG